MDDLLSARGSRVDKVVTFDVPDGELVIRMLGRAQVDGRSDDTPDTIRKRLEVYRSETAPLISYYKRHSVVTSIDATGTIDVVAGRVGPTCCEPPSSRVRRLGNKRRNT